MLPSKPFIFISFKSDEEHYAEALKKALEENFNVWWSVELQCGHNWHTEIDQALQQAAVIVVLWSEKSKRSKWVRHEASIAIAKGNYAPVRFELVEIETPYDQIQATDLNDWIGDLNDRRFLNLSNRIKELIPKPIPFHRKSLQILRKYGAALIFFFIVVFAIYLLLIQKNALQYQNSKQGLTYKNVLNQSKVLKRQGETMKLQIKAQGLLLNNVQKQSDILKSQLTEQNKISSTVQNQSRILKAQIQKQEKISDNIIRLMEPIQDISFDGVVSLDSTMNGFEKYTRFLMSKLFDKSGKLLVENLPKNGVDVNYQYNQVKEIYLSEDSGLWPPKDDNLWLYYVIKNIDLKIGFETYDKGPFYDDWETHMSLGISSVNEKAMICFNPKKKSLCVGFSNLPKKESLISDRKIKSVSDLNPTRLNIYIQSSYYPPNASDEIKNSIEDSRTKLYLDSFILSYSGRFVLFDVKNMNMPKYMSLQQYKILFKDGSVHY